MAKREIEDGGVSFFGEVDLNRKGEVGSFFPAWSYTQLIEDLKERIGEKERAIKSGALEAEVLVRTKDELANLKERCNAILESRPKIDNDKLNSVANSVGEKISEAMFTRDEREKGLADAHEELRRWTEPCIKLEGEEALMALGANVKGVKKGNSYMVTRTGAEKLWKIVRKALGESANTAMLRR